MFDGASHFNARDITQHNHFSLSPESRDDQAMKDLYAHVAPVAMHHSAARVDAPKCHEETREAVQEDMSGWTYGPSTSTSTSAASQDILWLTGPAGTGKTAIMGTVSDELEESGQLAATFYFSASMGPAGTTSKQFFVSTLAYQMAVHPRLKGRLASPILSAVRENPGIFDMSLKRQLEVLILQPLRAGQGGPGPASDLPTCILVDGVDECGGPADASGRSRQDDQIEILSILRHAVNDPAFPFRVIVASRPETWIRRYFDDNAAGKVREIFLDEKYSPDDDIQLYLQCKFAKMCRRCGLDPSAWPSDAAISRLVKDASGQFIYVATVLRFIDAPGAIPQEQLDIVLNLRIRPHELESNPLAMLDALYSSILKSTSNPETTVLWLKGLRSIQAAQFTHDHVPSAWTIDLLFESHAGQARTLLGGVPSLCYLSENSAMTDSNTYWKSLEASPLAPPGVSLNTCYAFYHKSFLDFLGDHSRCGVVFPDVDEARVDAWLGERIGRTLKCGGPEVPVLAPLLIFFQRSFLGLLGTSQISRNNWRLDDAILSECEPSIWLDAAIQSSIPFVNGAAERHMYIIVHHDCCSYRPCNPGCKRWRQAISRLPNNRWRQIQNRKPWSSFDILLDRFNIERLKPIRIRYSGRLFPTTDWPTTRHEYKIKVELASGSVEGAV